MSKSKIKNEYNPVNSIQPEGITIIISEINTNINIKSTLTYYEYKDVVQECVDGCFLFGIDGSEEYHPEFFDVVIAKALLKKLSNDKMNYSDELLWIICKNKDFQFFIKDIDDKYQLNAAIMSSINFRIQNIVARQSAKLDEIVHQITEYMKVYNSVGEQLKDFNAKEAMGYLKKMTGYSEEKIADNILQLRK